MRYYELSIHTTTEASDLVAELAREEGASGVSIFDRSDLESRGEYARWDVIDDEMLDSFPADVIVRAVFSIDRPDDIERAKARVHSLSQEETGYPVGTLESFLDVRDDADWADNWKAYFKPFRVGRRLVVKPTWESFEASADELVLELDPGMAFGTGTHETTSMCLELLEGAVLGGETVLDVGCGSGILAIAALKLGAARALAVDFDPDAARVAKANSALNGMESSMLTRTGDLLIGLDESEDTREYVCGGCDLLLANILADIIIRLAPSAHAALKPGGIMIASGIIRDREADVRAALESQGFAVEREKLVGEWTALAVRKA
ncbi:MAG: 50S ribosomal protein L11 methyltransferase [Oscillospiraceae bacterium]|nr:50S ribosomal protein L11 methyltransferase [Oscillospiraceae bacterium]